MSYLVEFILSMMLILLVLYSLCMNGSRIKQVNLLKRCDFQIREVGFSLIINCFYNKNSNTKLICYGNVTHSSQIYQYLLY